jgi:hypothetical protein
MRLGDIVGLTLGSLLAQLLALAGCRIARLSLFQTYIVVTIIGDLWLIGRYEHLANRRGWLRVQGRFNVIFAWKVSFRRRFSGSEARAPRVPAAQPCATRLQLGRA